MTPIQFTLTHADWVAAQRTNFMKAFLATALWTAFVISLIALMSTLLLQTTTDDNLLSQFATIAFVAFGYIICIQILTAIFGFPRYAKKTFIDNCSLAEPTMMYWKNGVINLDSKTHKSAIPYAHFSNIISNNKVCLLYRGRNLFHIIPARVFESQAQQEQLIAEIRAAKT
jgi:YcxB-like protein